MSKQIAAVDRAVMNELFTREYYALAGVKVPKKRHRRWVEEAFKDHGEYLDRLQESIIADRDREDEWEKE